MMPLLTKYQLITIPELILFSKTKKVFSKKSALFNARFERSAVCLGREMNEMGPSIDATLLVWT